MKKPLLYVSAVILPALCAIGVCNAQKQTEPVNVFVSIMPQKYFVERVGGDLVKPYVLVGPGHSPATYEPSPRQMSELSRAKIFFRIGVPFERSIMPKIESTFENLTVVDTRKGIKLRKAAEEHDHDREEEGRRHGEEHGAGHEAEHEHEAGAPDPHIWLDPILVKTQAKTICDALSKLDPEHAGVYAENLKDFQNDLDKINRKISKVLAPMKGQVVFVFHPAYGYFTDRYGLKQTAVETGGRRPTAKQLSALIDRAKHARVTVIFVQPQFDRKNAQAIADAIGGAVVSLDPLSPEYLKNLERMASRIESAQAVKE